MSVTHVFHSNVTDSADDTLVQPSHWNADHALALPGAIEVICDGGGAVLSAGVATDLKVPYAATITSWDILAGTTGSVVFDLWKDSYANFPPTVADTLIPSGTKPTLTSNTKAQSSNLTGWTTSLAAGDIIRVNIDSITGISRVVLVLNLTRST